MDQTPLWLCSNELPLAISIAETIGREVARAVNLVIDRPHEDLDTPELNAHQRHRLVRRALELFAAHTTGVKFKRLTGEGYRLLIGEQVVRVRRQNGSIPRGPKTSAMIGQLSFDFANHQPWFLLVDYALDSAGRCRQVMLRRVLVDAYVEQDAWIIWTPVNSADDRPDRNTGVVAHDRDVVPALDAFTPRVLDLFGDGEPDRD